MFICFSKGRKLRVLSHFIQAESSLYVWWLNLMYSSERLNLTLELSDSSLSLSSCRVVSRRTTRTTTITTKATSAVSTETRFVETFTFASRSSYVNFNWSAFEVLTCFLEGILDTTPVSEFNVSETSALK